MQPACKCIRTPFNSLWLSDNIWRHKSRSTLTRVMACCLTAPSHYLNQCWLLIKEVLWHLPKQLHSEWPSYYSVNWFLPYFKHYRHISYGPLTRYVKLRVAHAPGMPRTFPPAAEIQRKPRVSDPDMHHGTCVTHVPWCMSGFLTRGGGENVPSIPGACATAILRIWQEAHGLMSEMHLQPFFAAMSADWFQFEATFTRCNLQ